MNTPDRLNILLVDDQQQKLLSYEAILTPLGENLIRATSAREALEILLRRDIALMVVDVVMPEMDGFELAREIRGHPRFQRIPMIFVTAISTSPEELLQGYDLGAVDYVCVPIVPETLRVKVSVFVNLQRTTRALMELNRDLEQRVLERTEAMETALRMAETQTARMEQELAEREQMELALRSSEERFRLAVESAPSGMILTDEMGRILLINSQAESMFGYSRNQLLGQSVDGLVPDRFRTAHPGQRQSFFSAPSARAMGMGRELYGLRGDGSEFPVEIGLSPIATPQGLLVLSAIVDITERKNAERKLLDADRRKDEFLATLAHELRNPLAPLTNAVELLQSQSLAHQETLDCWNIVTRQLAQLRRLVDDLLDVSRITRNRIELRRNLVDVSTIVGSALDSCRPLLEESRHELRVDLPTDPIWIDVDEMRMIQVIANLLNNAIRYTDAGGSVSLSCRTVGDFAEIRVRDTGIGISDDLLPRIFDMFTQADTSLTRVHGGLGIGLSLVKSLVELHGGTVEASSRGLHQGSEFVVRLPIGNVARWNTSAPESVPTSNGAPLPRYRILVVDDMQASAHLL
ncbi:MAG TPA: ATP-binding protein, partial [Pirellulaceae bacterium]